MTDEINVKVTAEVDGLKAGMSQAEGAVKSSTKAMEDSARLMSDTLKSAFAGLAASLSVGLFASAIKGSIDFADNLNDLAAKTGASVETLAGFKLAAESSGASLEAVALGIKGLSQNIATNSDLMTQLGVSTRDPTEAMIQLADKFVGIESPADRSALAMKLFGKSGIDMLPMLMAGSDGMRQMIDQGQSLSGVTMEMAGNADAFNDKLGVMQARMQGNVQRIAGEMLPALNGIAEAFNNDSKQGATFSAVADGVVFVLRALASAGLIVRDVFVGLGDAIGGAAAAAMLAAQGEFRKAAGVLDEMNTKSLERGQALKETLKKLWSDMPQPDAARGGNPIPSFDASGILGGDGKKSKAQDNSAEEERKRKEAERLAAIEIEAQKNTDLQTLSLAEDQVAKMKALGDISAAESISMLQSLKQHEYEINLKAAQDTAALVEQEPVQKAQAYAKIEQLKLKHEQDMSKLEIQFGLARKAESDKLTADQQAKYETMFKPLNEAVGASIQGIVQGTTTMQKALSNIWQSIGLMIAQTITKTVTQWASAQMAKVFAAKTADAAIQSSGSAAALAGKATTIATATTEITANAATAASGAASAVAPTPFVGPAMAAAAFAAIGALVMGAMGMVSASAAGGYDIPAGVNPLVQTHAKEMILPAKYADTIRAMSEQQAGGGATNVTIHAVDAASVKQLFMAHGSSLADALKAQSRNFKT